MTSETPNKNIFAIGAIVLLAIVGVLFMTRPKSIFTPRMNFGLVAPSSEVKKGDIFTVDVTLSNKEASNITAYDVQIDYDKSKLKLVSVNPGGFFINPMVLKWDTETGWFSAAASPTGYKETVDRVNTTAPLFTLEFAALEAVDKGNVSIKNVSEVYIFQKGAASPKTANLEYTVK